MEEQPESHQLDFFKVCEKAAAELHWLRKENERLRADAARLDWLADKDNEIGNVQLPTHCVTANLGSLRDAIDMAMREQGERNKKTGATTKG